jgi:hypothetical protein
MQLMSQWTALTVSYTGWSLEEIQRLSPRERKNWLEIAREYGLVVKK